MRDFSFEPATITSGSGGLTAGPATREKSAFSSRCFYTTSEYGGDRAMTTTGTLGVDLAAQSRKTAGCVIEWDERGHGYVHCPADHYRDEDLFARLIDTQYITHAAIDAPFGWPAVFIQTITEYQAAGVWPDPYDSETSVRNLRLRATNRAIHQRLGLTPLTVSTDRIGIVAMHCARLLAAMHHQLGEPVDRSGQGRILEVYPAAAALRSWQINPGNTEDPGSYKGDSEPARTRREWVLEQISCSTSGWLEVNPKVKVVCDDCLKARICALIARAADCDQLEPIDDPDGLASSEGWISLPKPESLALLGVQS
jgi:hypothetical protein